MLNNELAEELQITNTIIRKFNKKKYTQPLEVIFGYWPCQYAVNKQM